MSSIELHRRCQGPRAESKDLSPYDTKVDIERVERVDKSAGANEVLLVAEDHHIRKIPIPSNDPNDPLRFPTWRKVGLIVTCCWYSIFSLIVVGGLGSFLQVLFVVYAEYSVQGVVLLSTVSSAVMAGGSLILLPISLVIGRRPVLICCSLVLLGSVIGAAVCTTYAAHMACRILQGLAAGATESLLPLIITDITYLNERGFWFGVYWGTQSTINAVFLIVDSYLVAEAGWRWFYGLFAVASGLGCIMIFFFAPETRFARSPAALDGNIIVTDEFGATHILTDEEALEQFGDVRTATGEPTEQQSYLASLKPMQGTTRNAWAVYSNAYVKILKACVSSGVIFASLVSSISLGIGIAMSISYSTLLTGPFGWPAARVGLFNVCVIPAGLAAILYGKIVADRVIIYLAKRNGGVHLPEHHFINLIIPFVLGVVGVLLFAVTAGAPESHSVWGLIMGWGLFELSFVMVLVISTTYGAEALPKNPGPAMVVVIGSKNIISFGAAYGLTPLINIYGYRDAFFILMGIFIGIFVIGAAAILGQKSFTASHSRERGDLLC